MSTGIISTASLATTWSSWKRLKRYLSPFYILHFFEDYLEYTSLEYAGIVTKEEMEKKEEEERKRLEKDERAKNERKCPACEKKVPNKFVLKCTCKTTFRFGQLTAWQCQISSTIQNALNVHPVGQALTQASLWCWDLLTDTPGVATMSSTVRGAFRRFLK